MPKWKTKWDVLSSSDPDKTYVVSRSEDGETWGCSCPQWKFRRKHLPGGVCGHIEDVQAGHHAPRGEEQKPRPCIVFAGVREVTLTEEEIEGHPSGPKALTPQYAIGDTHMAATIVYDLWKAGVPWGELKRQFPLAQLNSRKNIVAYVEERGRRVYGPLVSTPYGQTYLVVPVG